MSAVVDATESPQVQLPHQLTAAPELLPLTAERKLLCLEVLEKTGGNLSQAAKLLGTTRQNIHRWLQTDPAFAQLFDEVMEAGTENLEERYYTRAMSHSDRAAEFLLRARRPEKYRDVAPSVEGASGGEIAHEVVALLVALAERNRAAQAEQAQLAQLPPAVVIETTARDMSLDQTVATPNSEDGP